MPCHRFIVGRADEDYADPEAVLALPPAEARGRLNGHPHPASLNGIRLSTRRQMPAQDTRLEPTEPWSERERRADSRSRSLRSLLASHDSRRERDFRSSTLLPTADSNADHANAETDTAGSQQREQHDMGTPTRGKTFTGENLWQGEYVEEFCPEYLAGTPTLIPTRLWWYVPRHPPLDP